MFEEMINNANNKDNENLAGEIKLLVQRRFMFFVLVEACRRDCVSLLFQFVFKTEACGFRTVHEELAKGMTSDLKSNDQSVIRNILKVS